MNSKKPHISQDKIDILLSKLSIDFFEISNLDITKKRQIFSEIKKGILSEKKNLRNFIVKEVKLTEKDADKEIDRAYNVFDLAEKNINSIVTREVVRKGKRIIEKRICRGPLLAITPFSSPLSSPAHKIALGLIAGTSILFKPSRHSKVTGKAFFEIIKKATAGKYVYFYVEDNKKELQRIVSDDRIGIISFTGGYETGKNIIQTGRVKKYHMELSGGNSPVIFAPDYDTYDDKLIDKLLDGILAKNGQRCVSIKHIFIPYEQKDFVLKLKYRLISLKKTLQKDFINGRITTLGPLITSEYAHNTETKVNRIIRDSKKVIAYIAFERKEDFVFPSMYVIDKIDSEFVKHVLEYDLPGPVVFIHLYKNGSEFNKILSALKNDYIRSGLQLSFFLKDISSLNNYINNLYWGGVVINDIPTYRDEFMSFGGFGKAGLGKEGFFETITGYTDPQVTVFNT